MMTSIQYNENSEDGFSTITYRKDDFTFECFISDIDKYTLAKIDRQGNKTYHTGLYVKFDLPYLKEVFTQILEQYDKDPTPREDRPEQSDNNNEGDPALSPG